MTTRFDDSRRYQFVASLGVHDVYRDASEHAGETRLYLSAYTKRNNAVATVDKRSLQCFRMMFPGLPHILNLKTFAREVEVDLATLDPCVMDRARGNSLHHTFNLEELAAAISRSSGVDEISFTAGVVLEETQRQELTTFLRADPDFDAMVDYLRDHKLGVQLVLTRWSVRVQNPDEQAVPA